MTFDGDGAPGRGAPKPAHWETGILAYIRKSRRRHDDEGASAVEYGLLVAAVMAIIILTMFALGTFVKGAFDDTCTAFDQSNAGNANGPASSDCNG